MKRLGRAAALCALVVYSASWQAGVAVGITAPMHRAHAADPLLSAAALPRGTFTTWGGDGAQWYGGDILAAASRTAVGSALPTSRPVASTVIVGVTPSISTKSFDLGPNNNPVPDGQDQLNYDDTDWTPASPAPPATVACITQQMGDWAALPPYFGADPTHFYLLRQHFALPPATNYAGSTLAIRNFTLGAAFSVNATHIAHYYDPETNSYDIGQLVHSGPNIISLWIAPAPDSTHSADGQLCSAVSFRITVQAHGVTEHSRRLDDLIAAIEHLRVTTGQSLGDLYGGQSHLREAVLYFNQHRNLDVLQGAATVILDALSANRAAKNLWQGSLNDFLKQQSLTNTKALLADAAKDIGKDAATHLAKEGYDKLAAVLIDWLITGDPRAQHLLAAQINADRHQVDAAARAAETALRAHPPSAATAAAMEAALASVTSANNRIGDQISPLSDLLTTSYTLRQADDQTTTIFDNFFADTALYWGLTALSVPVGGWGGLANKGTKLAFHSLQTLGKISQDAQLVTSGAAASLAAIPLAGSLTTNAGALLKAVGVGTVPATPTGAITHLAGTESGGLLGPHRATLAVTVRAGATGGRYQAIVTYTYTQYTLPVPQGAYPVKYLAKSKPMDLTAHTTGTLSIDFLPGGSGTPPSDGAGVTVTVLATRGNSTYYIGQTGVLWPPA